MLYIIQVLNKFANTQSIHPSMPPDPSGIVEERKPKKPRSSKWRTLLRNEPFCSKDSRPAHSLFNESSAPSTVLERQYLREMHARSNQYKACNLQKLHVPNTFFMYFYVMWKHFRRLHLKGHRKVWHHESQSFHVQPWDLIGTSCTYRIASGRLRTAASATCKFKHVPTLTPFSHTVESIQKVNTAKIYSKNGFKNSWTSDVGMTAYFIVFHKGADFFWEFYFLFFCFSVWGSFPCYLLHFGAKISDLHAICCILEL